MKRQLPSFMSSLSAADDARTPVQRRKRLLTRRDASCCYYVSLGRDHEKGVATLSAAGVSKEKSLDSRGALIMGPPVSRGPVMAPDGFSLQHSPVDEISRLLSLGWRPGEEEVKALKRRPSENVGERCIEVLKILLEKDRRYTNDVAQRKFLPLNKNAVEAVLAFAWHASPRGLACRSEELLRKASHSDALQKDLLGAILKACKSSRDSGACVSLGLYSSLQSAALSTTLTLSVRQHAVVCLRSVIASKSPELVKHLAREDNLLPWISPLAEFRAAEFRTPFSIHYITSILGLLISISSCHSETSCAVLRFLGKEIISLLASPVAAVRGGAAKVLLAECRASETARSSLARLAAIHGGLLLRLFIGVIDRAPIKTAAVEDTCSLLVDLVGQVDGLCSSLYSIGVIPALRARMRRDGGIGSQAQALLNLTLLSATGRKD